MSNEKVEKVIGLLNKATELSDPNNMEPHIACIEEAISTISEMPFQEYFGQYPIYTIYNSLAIAIGFSGEQLRNSGKLDEALQNDFRAISLMEKAIEYSANAPANKQIQYKKDTIIACIYIATDLFKMKDLYASIYYCEIIIKYVYNIPLCEFKRSKLKRSICILASNYGARNLQWIMNNFGEDGVRASLQIENKLKRSTKRFLGLF